MLTSTHILIGAAVSSKPDFKPWQLVLAWAGGFMPDASIFLMVAYSRLVNGAGVDLWTIPTGLYWQEPWQTYSAVSNSFPLWGLVLLSGFLLYKYSKPFKMAGLGMMIFFTGYFLHISVDFITHADDAHVQFWPFSTWRFHSPISYYQPQYYGRIVGVFEAVMGLSIVGYLIIRFRQWSVRIIAAVLAVPYGFSLWLHF